MHDPGQALIRTDVVASLGLEYHVLFDNHRNPGSIAQLAARFYHGGEETIARPTAERRYTVISAQAGAATLDALRRTLHRLVEEERVAPFRIAVLSGGSAGSSEVWRYRRFGNAPLENAALYDDGSSRGLAPEDVPDEPDEVLFETIRRFKGLEREVVVLVELPTDGDRLDELLYVGLDSRHDRTRRHRAAGARASAGVRRRPGTIRGDRSDVSGLALHVQGIS